MFSTWSLALVTSFPTCLAVVPPRPDTMTAPALPPALLPRIALGDEAAFNECVRRYGRLVYAIARRYLREASDVEDACQEIFLALWRSAGAFDEARGTEATFIALVARRRLIDRQSTPGTRPLPNVDAEPAVASSALERYVDARAAAAALSACNEEQKRVIMMAAFQGLTHDEISKELAIPLGTVKSHYARGIDRVKRALIQGEAKS